MNLCILGSTGSIGLQTLDVVRSCGDIHVTAIAALKNIDMAMEQIAEFHPAVCCIYDKDKAHELRERLGNHAAERHATEIVSGMEGLIYCASHPSSDTVMVSVSGMIAIRPVIAAIESAKDICQANKETIVCAGHIIMPLAEKYGVRLTPVDSEHSAIYQCLSGEEGNPIDRIYLTCSGGPFRGRKRDELKGMTAADALKHPSWNMGAKITIDSSTLVNKGLEVIEAHYLFNVPADKITVLIQPGSIVHSMVQFEDGAIKAQLGTPDMRVPVSYALNHKRRVPFAGKRTLSPMDLRNIEFLEPDTETFRGLALGIEACREEGTITTVYNAANEECAAAFLEGRIGYLDIASGIEACMDAHTNISSPSLEDIFAAEREARSFIRRRYALSPE